MANVKLPAGPSDGSSFSECFVQTDAAEQTSCQKHSELASAGGQPGGESPPHDPEAGARTVFWHRELPPLHAEPLGEHVVEADSMHVSGSLAHRGELWESCYQDLMVRLEERLHQEADRLGGHYAHVHEESIDSKHDDRSGDVWLRGRLRYQLLRRPGGN